MEIDFAEKAFGADADAFLAYIKEKGFATIEDVIDLYDEIDHELSVFDLNDYNQKEIVDEKDNYSYELEENDYLYVNDFGMLILKIKPNSPQEIDLYIKAGHSTVKKIVIVINVKDRLIRHENNSNGTIYTMVCFDMTANIHKLIEDDENEKV